MPLSKASRPRDVSDEDQSNDSGVYDEYLSEDEGEEGGLEALNERRVAQWVDEDELEEGVDHEEESSSAESEASDEIVSYLSIFFFTQHLTCSPRKGLLEERFD